MPASRKRNGALMDTARANLAASCDPDAEPRVALVAPNLASSSPGRAVDVLDVEF